MASFKDREVKDAICKKGFERIYQGTKHIHYVLFDESGKKVAKTHFSKNEQDIDDYLLGAMAKEIGVSKREFTEFIRCHIDRDGLITLINRAA